MTAPWCRNKNVESIDLKFRRISLFTRTNKTAPKNFYRSLILLPAPKNLTAPAPALTKPHLKIFTRTNTAPAPAPANRTRTRTKTAPAPRRLLCGLLSLMVPYEAKAQILRSFQFWDQSDRNIRHGNQ